MYRIKNKVRNLLFQNMTDKQIGDFYKLYFRVFYPNEVEKKKSYGVLNSDKTFYLIRPRQDGVEGLMSLFGTVITKIYYAREKGYIPVVDFKNYNTQLLDAQLPNTNAWSYYFTQPSQYPLKEVYRSKNVVLSGTDLTKWYRIDFFDNPYNPINQKKAYDFIFSNIDFSKKVKDELKLEEKRLNIDYKETVGIYMRGTDYMRLKPMGHAIQPTLEQVIEVIDTNIKADKKLYLVTEDGKFYKGLKERYRDRLLVSSFDKFIYSYSENDYLSKSNSLGEISNSPYKRNLNYLLKLLILSKCESFIGGKTRGSSAAHIFSNGNYNFDYVFDLGLYGK